MKRVVAFLGLLIMLMVPVAAEEWPEYFTVGNPVKFGNDDFYFAWSAKPQGNYYYQEYIPKGETLEHFNKMVTVTVLFTDKKPLEYGTGVVSSLENRKKTDPVVNYRVYQNTGEAKDDFLLEFILSSSKDGLLDDVEVNLHLYHQATIDGKKAIVSVMYAQRAYDDDILPFIKSIPDHREEWYDAILGLNLVPKMLKK